MAALTARDRAATLAILENAQWVYALSRYPKKQVLDDAVDVKMLRDRIEAMRKASRELTAAQKKRTDVPWDELDDQTDDTPETLWKVAKKVSPKVVAGLLPLVRDTPEAAFFISPEPKKTRLTKQTAPKGRRQAAAPKK
jgi:hypothetical protein